MEKIKNKLTSYTTEDILKCLAIYAAALFLMIFLVLPLGTLFVKAFQDADGVYVGLTHFATYFQNKALIQSIFNTIFIAGISTVVSVVLAFIFSYCLTRKNIPGKGLFRYIGMIPIFAPTMLLGIGLIYLFGNKGILTAIGLSIPLYGKVGIIIAESLYCFPVATTILMVAFSSADNRLYEAADTMGASSFRKMMTITLPNVKYGLISAIFVAFTYSFTDFGAPSVVGGNYNVLATDVYKQVVGQQNFNMGAVVGIVLLLPAVVSFAVDRITSKKQNSAVGSKAIPYVIIPDKKTDTLSMIFCCFISALILLFFATSLFASLIKLWPYNLTLTLKNYDFTKVAAGDGMLSMKNSVVIALITAVLGTIITFLTAYLIEKNRKFKQIRKFTYFLSIAPLAIPGTVVGLSYIMFFNASTIPIPFTDYVFNSPFHKLYGTMWILIFANIIHYFSVPFTTATTALKKLDNEFEVVSDSMGVPFWVTLKRVTMPLCVPAMTEMIIYFFVNAMVTVSAVVFLYSPTIKIASVVIVNLEGAGNTAQAVAMCMALLTINIIVRFLYSLLSKIRFKH